VREGSSGRYLFAMLGRAWRAFYALWYNFVRIHNTLRMTAEIVAGIETHLLAMEDVVAMIDRRTATRTGTLLGS